MEGKAALAQTLRDYPGGVLLVSHDRQLISESCNRFWLIDSAGPNGVAQSGGGLCPSAGRGARPGQSARFAEYTRRG